MRRIVSLIGQQVAQLRQFVWGGETRTGGQKRIGRVCEFRDAGCGVDRVDGEFARPFVHHVQILAPRVHSRVSWIGAGLGRCCAVYVGQCPGCGVNAVRPHGIRAVVC